MNGRPRGGNWRGLFSRGERVWLRCINASAMTFFDVRIPGLSITAVAADGQNVQRVETDEFHISVAEACAGGFERSKSGSSQWLFDPGQRTGVQSG